MRNSATWAKRLAAFAIIPMAMLTAAGVPAQASGGAHPASITGQRAYQNDGSGLTTQDNCLGQNELKVDVGKPALGVACLDKSMSQSAFNWIWYNDGGTWWFAAKSNTNYCLAVNSSHNAYLDKCHANGEVDQWWDVDYLPGSTSKFLLVSQAYDLCLGVGSSSHVVEARACSTITHPNSYQVWKD
jgi:hypothetical protein